MGMFDKLRGRVTGTNNYNEDFDNDYYGGFDQNFDEPQQPQQPQNDPDAGYDYGTQNVQQPSSTPVGGMTMSGSAIELKVVKPTEFRNASQIADHLLSRRTVVLNLEMTDKETARRLIDFLTGVAYSIDGQIKRVANNAYVITPNNVDISRDQIEPKPQPQPQPQPAQPKNEEYYSDLA